MQIQAKGSRRWNMFNYVTSQVRRLWGDRSGAIAVEAALIFPVMIVLILGTIEFSIMFLTQNSVQAATRDAARQVSVNFITAAEAEDAVKNQLPDWSRDNVSVTVSESNPGDPEQNAITLRSTLMASEATPFVFVIQSIGDFELETEVTMRQELPF